MEAGILVESTTVFGTPETICSSDSVMVMEITATLRSLSEQGQEFRVPLDHLLLHHDPINLVSYFPTNLRNFKMCGFAFSSVQFQKFVMECDELKVRESASIGLVFDFHKGLHGGNEKEAIEGKWSNLLKFGDELIFEICLNRHERMPNYWAVR